jgi:N-acetylmuramoyl-L-alanine amidase
MPCILVEVAFITNPRECRRLNTAGYQDDIADAIAAGIQHYVELNTAGYQDDIADAIAAGIQHYVENIHPAALTRVEAGKPIG